jgi:hypothetical protein
MFENVLNWDICSYYRWLIKMTVLLVGSLSMIRFHVLLRCSEA